MAASYNADNGQATFYADGNSQGVTANPGFGEIFASLGGLYNYADHTVDALVDEVFLYDHDLSAPDLD